MKPAVYSWVVVGLLAIVAFLNYVDRQLVFSVFPLLEKDLNLTTVQFGLLSTIFLWVYGLLSPVAGYLGDRFGYRKLILLSVLVWSVVTWATAHAQSFFHLATARGAMGISEAFYMPAALALITSYHGEPTRARAIGLHEGGIYLGVIGGGYGGALIAERLGWRQPFVVFGVVGIVYALLLALVLENKEFVNPTKRESLSILDSFRSLLSSPSFLVMTAVFSAVSIANWVVFTWLAVYVYERFATSLSQAGFSATFYVQCASFVGILAGGWLADRWRVRSSRGRVLTQVVGLGIAGPFLVLSGVSGSMPLLIAGLLMFGLGRGLYECNAMPVLCQFARYDQRSTGFGIFNFAGCIAGGAAAAASGYLKSSVGIGGALALSGVLLILSALLLLLKLRPDEPDANQEAVAPICASRHS